MAARYLDSLLKGNHERKLGKDGQMSLFRYRQLRRLKVNYRNTHTHTILAVTDFFCFSYFTLLPFCILFYYTKYDKEPQCIQVCAITNIGENCQTIYTLWKQKQHETD